MLNSHRLIAAAFVPLLIGWLPAAEPALSPQARDEEIFIVINGEPTSGRAVLPASENEFKFRLSETGDVVVLRWSQLEDNERRRVQKLYGMEISEDRKVFGKKIGGVKLTLRDGRCLEGLRLPDRDQPGQKAIRTARTRLMLVPERDIVSEERIEWFESDFFSPLEIYERMLNENPPGKTDAGAHLEFARKAAGMSLFRKALDHLEMAEVIDPRTASLYKEMRQQLKTENEREQSMKVYLQMLQFMRGDDFITALKLLESLDRLFPNSEIRSRWDSVRSQVETGAQAQLVRKIVPLFYTVAQEMIQKKFYKRFKVDEHGNVIPCMPGKQVTTNAGHMFRGLLISYGGPGSDIKLKVEEMTLTIRGKDVSTVQDIDLAVGASESTRTFEELRRYIADTRSPEGLKYQVMVHIARHVEVKEARVAEIFENRLHRDAVYEDGKLTKSQCYASVHEASYGLGSWLRDGTRFIPYHRNDGLKQALLNEHHQDAGKPAREKADPTTIDDPEEWWKLMPPDVQLSTLYAIAAEKVFSVVTVHKDPCPSCNGDAVLKTGEDGEVVKETRCPQCHGVGIFFRISYE